LTSFYGRRKWNAWLCLRGSKQFFFEKKNQKTFDFTVHAAGKNRDSDVEVFCFFSSEKKTSTPEWQSMHKTFLAAAIMLSAAAPFAMSQTIASGQREILVQSDHSWNGKPYTHYPAGKPELTVIKLVIAAHTALPWHTHPIPNAGYVLSGALTVIDKDSGKRQTFTAGQAFTESVDDVHHGMSGDEPTTLILMYAGTAGTPTSVPVKGQMKEY
jgi:quercetin dioxygenase-like cupin family protein